MRTKTSLVPGAVIIATLAISLSAALAQTTAPDLGIDRAAAEAVFVERCKSCHEPAADRAPSRQQLAQRSADSIVQALTQGVMAPMAAGLSPAQVRDLAVHITGRAIGQAVTATPTDVMCAARPPIRQTPSSWTTFGLDPENTRYQPNPGLRVQDIPRLKVKWAFSYRGGVYGQPTVVGDRLFITARAGPFYSLDARTGCVHWRVDRAGARTTPLVAQRPLAPSGWVTFIGVGTRIVAYDAQDGRELWRSEPVDAHPNAILTGSPVLHGEQLFVPVSSGEGLFGTVATYACCTFRGSIVALDARTGRRQWKSHAIDEPLGPTRISSQGVQLQGPAGAAIWSTPAVDARRGLIYVGTGASYTDAPTKGADAIIAFDMATGAKRWINQATENDNWMVNCDTPQGVTVPAGQALNEYAGSIRHSPNCPNPLGGDFDFGASVVLKTLTNGRQIILAGQKSGVVYGMDAETGRTLWSTRVGAGSNAGGILWGLAADERYVYAPNADLNAPPSIARPGLTALDIATGKVAWFVPAPKVPCRFAGENRRDRGCFNAQGQAVAAMPGAVFSGTVDGRFRAYSSATGRILWTFDTTAQTYDTVNGVKGQPGGSMDGMGPAIAGGMVYVMSGYGGSANVGANPVNVLLAFSVDGR